MSDSTDGKIRVRTLQIMHLAMTGGVAFLVLTIFLIMNTGLSTPADPGLVKTLNLISNSSFLLVVTGILLFKRKISKADALDINGKMTVYREAALLRNALMEVPAMISIVSYFLTGRTQLLYLALMVLLVMAFLFPTRSRLCTELGIDDSQLE